MAVLERSRVPGHGPLTFTQSRPMSAPLRRVDGRQHLLVREVAARAHRRLMILHIFLGVEICGTR
ncbi:MAG: hypothetical protein AAF355_01175 [Myxococcota bacterium]